MGYNKKLEELGKIAFCFPYRKRKGHTPDKRAHCNDIREKAKVNKIDDDLRPQYNFDYSKAVRGKYFKRLLEEGANVVVLDLTLPRLLVVQAPSTKP
jgi:hypothetical protein